MLVRPRRISAVDAVTCGTPTDRYVGESGSRAELAEELSAHLTGSPPRGDLARREAAWGRQAQREAEAELAAIKDAIEPPA